MPLAQAAVVEVGDLNIINAAGNPSDGLRFLDMTYSDGLTLTAALADATAVYANARAATPGEFDDLFAAAGINYVATTTASGGFAIGGYEVISEGSSYAAGPALISKLGITDGMTSTFIWTDPDGSNATSTTRDYLALTATQAFLFNSTSASSSNVGWLLVSDAAVVPVPAAVWLFGSGLLGLVGIARRNKAA